MKISERFEGCIICGAIGDAYGSAYENLKEDDKSIFYLYGKPKELVPKWKITDDTQLTLATCDAIIENKNRTTEAFAKKYLDYFKRRIITGIGSSTLKALNELEVGGHWSQTGRRGEFGAGNGSAMRIAPLAFIDSIKREQFREIGIITHNNDEAYIGSLSVSIAIKSILKNKWTGQENLLEIIIDQIPDTKLRDRLIEIKDMDSLIEIGAKGNNGYVVNSIPLAIAAANKVKDLGVKEMFKQLIEIGGDTDTNASIAGQIVGTLVGKKGIPKELLMQLAELNEYNWINNTIQNFIEKEPW
jgi:ADP-ribosylglycohydrolase